MNDTPQVPATAQGLKALREIAGGIRLYGAPDPGLLADRIERRIFEVQTVLTGCVEHMEHSTPQGKAAYQAALAALASEAQGARSAEAGEPAAGVVPEPNPPWPVEALFDPLKNEDFLEWAGLWFGGDADETYLKRAFRDLSVRAFGAPVVELQEQVEQLTRALREATEPPMFMGEPALATHPAHPQVAAVVPKGQAGKSQAETVLAILTLFRESDPGEQRTEALKRILSAFAPAPQAREPAEPVAWIDPADFETLESDGWCVVHKSRCDPGADHSADVPLYAPSQAEPAQPHPCSLSTTGGSNG